MNNPKDEYFLRRSLCSAVVVDKNVYIDGGEISFPINETGALPTKHPSWPVNETLSIGLDESWVTADVIIKSRDMKKPGDIPRLLGQAVWSDNNNNPGGFFVWGGQASYNDTVAPSKVWRYQADVNGRGHWENFTVSNQEDFTKLKQPMGGAFAKIKNVGYYLGGGKFNNASSTGFGDYNTFRGGSMEAVPFGPEGLLLVLGGRQAIPSVLYENDWKWMDFSQVSIYDPKAGKWHTQHTTGSPPTRREKFCTVGVDGPDNTYDIFIYGGSTSDNDDDISDEVYVLTLPGFKYFKASSASSTNRIDHACVQIGKRYMLSIGGTSSKPFLKSWTEKDPWNRGLGVFDMTQMSWVHQFNESAVPYDSPDVVKKWYNEGGRGSANWSSEEVRSLFAQHTNNPNPGASSKPPTGAIIGGAVGGVLGLALIIGLVLFFLRRRKRQTSADDGISGSTNANPPAYEKHGSEVHQAPRAEDAALRGSATTHAHEMPGDMITAELPGDYELSERSHFSPRNEVTA
ncbi:kelch repeat protein [Colletotrichum camelliae]|nr:kelch repeat protein [Colletotrichum camelliae]